MDKAGYAVVAFIAALSAAQADAQGWSPQRNVDLIVPSTAGGSLDTTGRTITRIWGI
jgi:tripartite-type tricarboxylate transporter receptor subunit TctC